MTTQPPYQQPPNQQPPNQQPPYQQPPYPQGGYQQPGYYQQQYWYTQQSRDVEHVRLLSIFHYILGGLAAFGGSVPLVHVTIGVLMVAGTFSSAGGPPAEFGWLFVIMGAFAVIIGWTVAILLLTAAGRLKRMQSWTFCFVVACISCAIVPMGTVLGIFTIMVLSRPSVKAAFAQVRAAG